MATIFKSVWHLIGRQYEALVYERSRLANVAAQRQALKLETPPQPDTNLERKIQLTETILAALAELKDLENEI